MSTSELGGSAPNKFELFNGAVYCDQLFNPKTYLSQLLDACSIGFQLPRRTAALLELIVAEANALLLS